MLSPLGVCSFGVRRGCTWLPTGTTVGTPGKAALAVAGVRGVDGRTVPPRAMPSFAGVLAAAFLAPCRRTCSSSADLLHRWPPPRTDLLHAISTLVQDMQEEDESLYLSLLLMRCRTFSCFSFHLFLQTPQNILSHSWQSSHLASNHGTFHSFCH